MALTGMAIAAALALAKDQLVDQPAAKRKRKLAATTQRLSPWTGLKAENVDDPNTIGTVMQGAASGAQMGAGIEQNKADLALKEAMTKRANSGWGGLSTNVNTGASPMGGQSANPWGLSKPYDPNNFWSVNPY